MFLHLFLDKEEETKEEIKTELKDFVSYIYKKRVPYICVA